MYVCKNESERFADRTSFFVGNCDLGAEHLFSLLSLILQRNSDGGVGSGHFIFSIGDVLIFEEIF